MKMQIKSIRKADNLAGKKILLRVDFDVLFKNGVVEDDYKIKANLLTLKFLTRQKCKIIIISHLAGKKSLKPIAIYLNKLLNQKVSETSKEESKQPRYNLKFVDECIGFKAEEAIAKMKEGEIIVLENLYLCEAEVKNNNLFAQRLARLGDIYVNNAFSLSYKRYASIDAIKKYLPTYAGILLEGEVSSLNKILNPTKPFVVIIGGIKAETKFPLISKFYEKADYILLGGAISNIFLKALNFEIGKSLVKKVKENNIMLVKKKATQAKKRKILTPLDVVVETKDKDNNVKTVLRDIKKVKKEDTILDIGPKTITLYSGIIKQAKTIVWSGPLGKFEKSKYKHGTLAIARMIATRSQGPAFGVASGNKTTKALRLTGMSDYIDWISSREASLAYLNGREMPGLKGIIN